MARKQSLGGAYVEADIATGGPVGAAVASSAVSYAQAAMTARVTLLNYLRQCLINAGLGIDSGSIVAEAQGFNTPYVRIGVATGGTFAAALGAASVAYVQAEFTAARVLANQLRTCLLNARLAFPVGEPVAGNATASLAQFGLNVERRMLTGGTAPAAASAQTSSYVQADVQSIDTVVNFVRAALLNAHLAADNAGMIEQIVLAGSAHKMSLAGSTMTLTATKFDTNGLTVAGTITWTSSNGTVATVNSGGVITAHKAGDAIIVATAPSGVRQYWSINVYNDLVPASISVTPASGTLDLSDVATQQLTVVVLNAGGDDITSLVTHTIDYVSGTPAHASVSVGGLVTPVGAGSSTVTATLHGTALTDTYIATVVL